MSRKRRTTDYVFDIVHIRERAQDVTSPNHSAYVLLYEALRICGSSEGKPGTRQEAEQMQQCLRQAERLRTSPDDALLNESLTQLRIKTGWALRRHWNLSWFMIGGVLLSIFLFKQCRQSYADDLPLYQTDVQLVEKWTPCDTLVSMQSLSDYRIPYDRRFVSANHYKLYRLYPLKRHYMGCQQTMIEAETSLDTCRNETRRDRYKHIVIREQEIMEDIRTEYDALNRTGYEELRTQALAEVRRELRSQQKGAARADAWMWFFIGLIPLYIFAARPYGYQVNGNVAHARRIHLVKRFGLLVAGGLGTASMALYVSELVTRWSDGTVTREADGTAPVVIALKVMLLVAAVLVLCFTACLLMLYATVYGLLRYYDWKHLLRRHSR